MGEPRIAVRILGIASTTSGFAFAVTEGPRRLVNSGLREVSTDATKTVKAIDAVLRKTRPLFVAFEREASLRKRHRGQLFAEIVTKACDAHGIMMLTVKSRETKALSEIPHATKWDVAEAIAELFPETENRLPPRRKPWQSEDDRIGLFMALAAAVAAWESFRRPH